VITQNQWVNVLPVVDPAVSLEIAKSLNATS
jgi:hypothetical protein